MATTLTLPPTTIQMCPEDRAIAERAAHAEELKAVALQRIEIHLHNLAQSAMVTHTGGVPQWR